MLVRALITLVALLLVSDLAHAESDTLLWSQATDHMGEGNDARAAELLQILSVEHPESPFADDALFLAAQLLEEKLSKPAQARVLYQKLTKDYPDSRASLAASRRLAALNEALGTDEEGVAPLVRFQTILKEFPNRSLDTSEAMAMAVLRDFPHWTGAHRIQLWLASSARSRGDLEAAESYYDEIRSGDAPRSAKLQALFGASEIHVIRGQYDSAIRLLDSLDTRTDLSQGEVESATELREKLHTSQNRSRLLQLSLVVFSTMLVSFLVLLKRHCASWSAFGRALRTPPSEFFYLLPICLLFVIMAMTGHEEIGPAVAIICGGGLIVSWIAGVTMSAMSPLTPGKAILSAAFATAATSSLCYFALYRSQLLDLVATTVRFGPE
ncbi:MAG: tetratricopeptide repeat protein [Kofleriaceae bacterium]|nr:tetratricopeptide repeat protein [Kofleriaceae bacterium]